MMEGDSLEFFPRSVFMHNDLAVKVELWVSKFTVVVKR